MKWLPKIRSESGMTLIELMIAIAISGIVIAGVVQILTTSTSSYSLQEEMAAMQQNVRIAKMFLERDIRMAGCGMKDFYDRGTRVYPVVFTNAVCSPDSTKANQTFCTDTLVINYLDLDNANCDNVLPQLTLNGKMPVASAEATVNEDLRSGASPPTPPYSAWDNEFVCAGATYGGTPFKAFKAIITSPDGLKSDVVYVTQVQANSDKLQNRPYAGFDNKVLNEYPPGSTINFFSDTTISQITYSYSNGMLLRTDGVGVQELADNIEDLQFAFGLDTNADDIVDKWVADGISGDNVLDDTEKDQVRLIRINVLGRTSHEHPGQSSIRSAIEDHVAGTSSDKFSRTLFQLTIKPRNF
jgi:prepilin-type N-terminal cleavage/methylation domain-containing protein